MKLPILLGVLTAAVLMTGSASQAATQTTSLQILQGGSDTTYYMMTALGDLYNQAPGCNQLASPQPLSGTCPNSGSENKADFENYFHDMVVQRFPIGSSGGINQICQTGTAGVQLVQLARSSRVPLPAASGGSDCTGLHFVGYARDGISWECFPGATGSGCASLMSGTANITIPNLKKIFVSCTITNWNQVGGSNVPMDVYVAQANSGTGVTWAAAMGVTLAPGQALTQCVANPNNPNQPGSNVSAENTNNLIHTNGDEANAIFYYSVGVYHRTYGTGFSGSDGSQLGKINGQLPTTNLIQAGTFAVSRYLFNVYCKGDPAKSNKCGTAAAATANITKFGGEAGFLCKGEAAFNDTHGNPIVDPLTSKAYRSAPNGTGQPTGEIPATITAQGFVPLKKQSDGTYCVTFVS
ncbi:MAG: substrate-binding domain-containing protein [Gaiellales bacterium]